MQVSGNVRPAIEPVVRRASPPTLPAPREAAAEAAPVSLSPEAAELKAAHDAHAAEGKGGDHCPYCASEAEGATRTAPDAKGPGLASDKAGAEQLAKPGELSDDEKAQVKELKARDKEVRTHEQAHLAAAGSLANGGAKYEFQRGPDGKNYAVGGHVNIDTSKGRNPEETLAKANQIRRAALAPAEPSGQDRRVAAKASRMASEARQEMREASFEEAESASESAAPAETVAPAVDAPADPETVAQAFDVAASHVRGESGADSGGLPTGSARRALRAYSAAQA